MRTLYQKLWSDPFMGPNPTAELIGDNDVLDVGGYGNPPPTAGEKKLAGYRINAYTHAYFVRTSSKGPGLRGLAFVNWIPEFAPLYPGFVVFNSSADDTYAHEFGHVLGLRHVGDPSNLMAPGDERNFTDLITEAQADTMRASPLVHN